MRRVGNRALATWGTIAAGFTLTCCAYQPPGQPGKRPPPMKGGVSAGYVPSLGGYRATPPAETPTPAAPGVTPSATPTPEPSPSR